MTYQLATAKIWDGAAWVPAKMPVAPFNPQDLSPDLWLDASDATTITASGTPAKVSQWVNKGSVSANFTQATGANQPTTGATTKNGLNVLDFDGGDYLNSSVTNDWKFLHDGTKYFVCIAITVGTGSNPNAIYAFMGTNGVGSANVGCSFAYEDRTAAVTNNATRTTMTRGSSGTFPVDVNVGDTWIPNQWNVVTILLDPSASIALDRNAVKVNAGFEYRTNTQSFAVSTANPTYALQVGAAANNFGPMVGSIGEIFVVQGANATQENRDKVIGYLNAKWSVF
jgi:hypothetical protein